MGKKKEGEKPSQNTDNNKAEKAEISDDEEPNFSDPEGFEDDVSDDGKFFKSDDKSASHAREIEGLKMTGRV